jgi:glycosyltransferase involved in cell wall biosynthesis
MAELDKVARGGVTEKPAAHAEHTIETIRSIVKTGLASPAHPFPMLMRIAVHDYAGHPFQFELSRGLAERGHEVRHFFFADDPGPKGVTTRNEADPQGFTIAPIHISLPYSKGEFLLRFLGDRLYARQARRQIERFRPDVIISGNTPLDAQWALKQAATRTSASFVFWVQDFYSLAIERALSGRWRGIGDAVVRWYRRKEEILLRDSDGIVLISPDFRKYLPPSSVGSNAVHVVRNWGALNLISPRPRDNPWRARMKLDGKRVIMYTGTLGLKHDPNLLLSLADGLADHDDVVIVVVAAGVNADFLKAELEARPRQNFILHPLQPAADLPDVLATADVLLALLESDAAEFSVPSKLLSYLCAGRAIVLSAPPENLSVAVLTESGGGVTVPAADIEAFVTAVKALIQEDARRDECGRAGRAYAEEHFQISNIVDRFEEILRIAIVSSKISQPSRPAVN